MAEVVLRAGLNPADPQAVQLAVVIDPEGSAGERAVFAIGSYCYLDEDVEVGYVLQTDAWADRHLENGELTVDFMVYPREAASHHDSIDEATFPERSPHDPDALRVLRVTGTTTHDTLPDVTLVYTTPLDQLTEDDWPLVFAPPPEH
jgi:hypothetical protein